MIDWNRICSVAMQVGTVFFAVLTLLLELLHKQLSDASWTHAFDFISLVRKYATISPHPEAFSVGMGAAIIVGIAAGLCFGLLVRLDRAKFGKSVSGWPRSLKIIGAVFLPGMAVLPFLNLGAFNPSSRHDRWTSFILGNELSTAVFVGAMYIFYFAIYLFLALLFRHLSRR